MNEVERPILSGSSNPLPRGLIIAFHEGLLRGADQRGVPADLDSPLHFLKHGKAPGLFLLRDVIFQRERGRIGPARVTRTFQDVPARVAPSRGDANWG